jgi:hypothetical protein
MNYGDGRGCGVREALMSFPTIKEAEAYIKGLKDDSKVRDYEAVPYCEKWAE